MYYSTEIDSPVGILTLASDGTSLTGLWIEGQKYHGGNMTGDPSRADGLPVFDQVRFWLSRYFAGERPAIAELPLAPAGSEFRQAVWRILCQIPYGSTVTYGEIARQIARETGKTSMASQAVGGAVGHNPISIIIPCHRVVGSSGGLTGYAAGIPVKAHLLALESQKLP